MGSSNASHSPSPSGTALLLVDVIGDMEFDGGERLLEHALPAAERIHALAGRARAAGVPVIYANDNFGSWRDDFREVLRHCLEDGVRGEPVARLLAPEDEDCVLLKPRHSAFLHTPLELLLGRLEVEEVIIAGFVTEQCVQITAADAYLREYRVRVPRDCSAAETKERHEAALRWMAHAVDADTGASDAVRF